MDEFVIAERDPERDLELIRMWRRSFERALNIPETPADADAGEFADQLRYFRMHVVPECTVCVSRCTGSDRLAGFVAYRSGFIEQLYLDVGCQRRGLGSRLLEIARRDCDIVELDTMQLNVGAQAFYEHHGFHAVAFGYADRAANPWATYGWQLRDIRYRWQRA